MIAIDARTGRELWKTVPAGDPKHGYAFTVAPLVVKDKVIAGTAGGEFGVRGFIAAWDVKTGKEVWRFNTVPGPGEPGNETWSGDSWMHGGAPDLGDRFLRSRTEPHVLGNRQSRTRLGWRRPSRRQPLQLLCDCARCRHGQAEVALPVFTAQRVRLGFHADSGAGRYGLAGHSRAK